MPRGEPIKKEKFPHQIVNNLFSHNTKVADNGYNEEENKMVQRDAQDLRRPEDHDLRHVRARPGAAGTQRIDQPRVRAAR